MGLAIDISTSCIQDLTAETAKLKSAGNMESISTDKLVKLLNILELNIRDGSRVCPLATGEEDDSEEDSLFLEVCPIYFIIYLID